MKIPETIPLFSCSQPSIGSEIAMVVSKWSFNCVHFIFRAAYDEFVVISTSLSQQIRKNQPLFLAYVDFDESPLVFNDVRVAFLSRCS